MGVTPTQNEQPRVRRFAPLRERDFALFWTGQSVSVVGDGLFTVALAIQTLRVSSSTAAFGFVLAARSVPRVLFVLVGGAVGDRLPKRLSLLATDVERCVVVALIALGAATHSLRLWHLLVMATLFGIGDAFFFPISTAIVPELLPVSLLLPGNALNYASRLFGEDLLGPATGGVLVAEIGTAWAFGADALSFALSGVCLLAMRPRRARDGTPQHARGDRGRLPIHASPSLGLGDDHRRGDQQLHRVRAADRAHAAVRHAAPS
ncbi:MAG: MFS transporter, partial [Actinomycetota bacterium]